MKQQLKITFKDKQSQPAVFRLTNVDGAELLRRNIKTAPGVNAINLPVKYKGIMIVSVESANYRLQKKLLFK